MNSYRSLPVSRHFYVFGYNNIERLHNVAQWNPWRIYIYSDHSLRIQYQLTSITDHCTHTNTPDVFYTSMIEQVTIYHKLRMGPSRPHPKPTIYVTCTIMRLQVCTCWNYFWKTWSAFSSDYFHLHQSGSCVAPASHHILCFIETGWKHFEYQVPIDLPCYTRTRKVCHPRRNYPK